MAEEQSTTAPVEAQTTTAPEATTEPTAEAPKTVTEGDEATKADADHPTANGEETEGKPADPVVAEPQATTEVNASDGETAAAASAPTTATEATPSSSKDKKRRSSAGVPEHKTKKLNKKKSTVQLNLSVEPGEYYWARLKGYPNWPSIVCDEEMLPEALLGSRPISTKRVDGSYREDFLEGGKNARDRTYPIMFLGTNEFAWMVNTSLSKLNPEDLNTDKTGKMSKSLQEAYEIAKEQHDLQYFKDMLRNFQQEQKELEEQRLQKEQEKEEAEARKKEKAEKEKEKEKVPASEKKAKKPRKSESKVVNDDDMDIDEAETPAPKSSKKRKKDVESEGEGPKPKKTPKSIKLNASKTPNGESAAKKASKPKKTVSKPKTESEDDKEEEAPLTEAEKVQRREKAILYLRHRLQKGFLSRDQAPKEEEMNSMNEFFTQLEGYADLEPQIIRSTKIHKVLKAIVRLTVTIPKEEEFNFKKRSNDLLASWNASIGDKDGDAPASAAPADKEATATPADGEGKTEAASAVAPDEPAKTDGSAEKEAAKEPSAAPVETTTEIGNAAVDEADTTMTDAKDDKPAEAGETAPAVDAPAVTETPATAAE